MLHSLPSNSIWRHRDLRLLIPARAFSVFGDDMALLVLTLRLYDNGLGPWSITGLLLCSAVPVVVLAPLAGRLVDSVSFRTLAVTTAVWQGGCAVALAFAGPLWTIYALVLLLQAGHVVAGPAWQALVPSIAERDELGRAVSTSQAMNTVASVAAPAVAGLTVGLTGYALPLLIDAGTFLALGAAALAIRATRQLPEASAADGTAGARTPYSLRTDPLLWPLMVGVCVLVLAGEVTNVVEVFLLRGTLGASTTTFGLVGAALAGAIVVGSIAAGRTVSDSTRALRVVASALVLALALACGGLAPTVWVFALTWVLVGVANGIVNVDASTLILSRTPEFCRGRALATVNGMVRGSSLGAMALGGLAGSVLGPRATFVASGTLMAAVAVVLLVRIRQVVGAAAVRAGSAA